MASPSYTHTLTNGTTASATEVMQNFNDILNGVTDGTKDISVSAITAAGATSLNGNVTLGNATSDDVTVTGSLASTVPIKTTNSFDIGSSTLGLRALYLGANSQTVNIKGSGSMSATWTFTLPVSGGTKGQCLVNSDSSGTSVWGWPYVRTGTSALSMTTTDGFRWVQHGSGAVADRQIDLPDAASSTGRPITFLNSSSYKLTIARAGSDTIGADAATSVVLANAGDWITLVAIGSVWEIVDRYQKKNLELVAYGGTSYGSSDNRVMRYSTVPSDNTDVDVLDSASSGTRYQILVAGVYAISLCATFNAAAGFAIGLNPSSLTADINTTDAPTSYIAYGGTPANNVSASISVVKRLAVNDIVYPMGDTTTRLSTRPNGNQFRIIKIAD